MSDITIPFNKPAYIGTEEQYISEVLHSGHQSGDGVFTKKCNTILEQALGVEKVLLTTSCTHALEMAAILLDIKPGDEVIIPSFTFVSTVNAFVLRGAKPVFIDIRPDTLNLDEDQLERLITPKTRAVVPVHYAGVGCEMDQIGAICRQHNLKIVEDNAHGLFGKYKDRWLGTFGALATQSFHETKNFSCGEGGALVINDPSLKERAEIIREKGTNRSRFFRGQVDKYTWVDIGSSYLPSETLAAVLYAQLEARQQIQQRRGEIWHLYNQELKNWGAANQVRLPFIPADREQTYHMFYLLFPSLETRTRFIQTLREKGIYSVFHYLPLHLSDMGRKFGGKDGDCPVTEDLSDRLVRLPLFYNLTASDQEFILETITRIRV
ncbi:MAG TPA: dTDP-4-amino-4,6-dideoxygalactose transaminase [Bellilinea sp.]|nr:dTDP-4-amino-4,6-dideoxygalactose transaminase [Bellilinea sp.]